MSFCYFDDIERYTGPVIPYHRLNANKAFLRHLENHFYLKFIFARGTFQEKTQANKEIAIAEKSMAKWRQHPNYDAKAIAEAVDAIKAKWSS